MRLLFLGGVAVGTRVLTFAIAILFLRGLASGAPVRLRGVVELPPPRDPGDIALWAAALVVSAGLMAFSQLAEARLRIRLGQEYARSLVERIYRLLQHRLDRSQDPPTAAQVRRLFGGSAVLTRTVQPALAPLVPALTILVALAAMVWLDPVVTSLMVVLGLAYLVPFYRMNRRIVAASRRRERLSNEYREITRSAASAALHPQYRRLLGGPLPEAHLNAPAVVERGKLFGGFMLNRRRVTALNNASFGVALLLLVALGLTRRTSTGEALTQLITYTVLLRLSYGSAQHITTSVAGFNRFLPQFSIYVDFLTEAEQTPTAAAPAEPRTLIEIPPDPGARADGQLRLFDIVDLPDQVDLAKSVVLCIGAPPPRADLLSPWWRSLTGGHPPKGLSLVEDPPSLPDLPLHELLAPDGGDDDLEPLLRRLGVAKELSRLPDGLATRYSACAGRLSRAAHRALALAPSWTLPAQVTVMPLSWWEQLDEAARSSLPGGVVLVAARPPAMLPPEVDLVVALLPEGPGGFVAPHCYRGALPRLRELAVSSSQSARRSSVWDGDLEEDDEDDDVF